MLAPGGFNGIQDRFWNAGVWASWCFLGKHMYFLPRKVAGEVGLFLFSLWKISFLWRDRVVAGTPAKSPTRHASARPDLGELPPRQRAKPQWIYIHNS